MTQIDSFTARSSQMVAWWEQTYPSPSYSQFRIPLSLPQLRTPSVREGKTTLPTCGSQRYRETLLSLGRKPAEEAAGNFRIFCVGP